MKTTMMNSHSAMAAMLAVAAFTAIANTASAAIPLVNHTDTWNVHKGTNAPQASWQSIPDASLNGTWFSAVGGFGYGDAGIVGETTTLSDMLSRYRSFFIRKSFTIASAVDTNLHLQLTIDFDDGYVAYLDGVELSRANVTNIAITANASANHEASCCDTPLNPASVVDLGAVSNRLSVGTHILAIQAQNVTVGSSDAHLIADLAVVTNDTSGCSSGAIAANTTWYASNSPIVVCGSITINSGVTLTIEPGTQVLFNSGVNMLVANGGRVLAEGTSNAPILFSRSGVSGTWGGVTINGSAGSPETRIANARFEFNTQDPCIHVAAGTVFFDHLTFGNTSVSYIHLDGASFKIQDCEFPSATSQFELVHGTGGIKSGGHGIFVRNFFGLPLTYNDVVDFTGGNRSGPIIHFLDNVFIGASDDILDLDGTDAWVEGNIFLHSHKNGSPDTSSAVSGSDDSGSTSEITIIGNIIYDCDHAVMAKGGNFYTLINNTIVHQTHQGGTDTDGAVVCMADVGFGEGAGMYLEGNIIYDAEKLLQFHTNSIVTFTNNLMQLPWAGPGGNNSTEDPLLTHVPLLSETTFTNWAQAQIMKQWFKPQTNSPAIGTGPNGLDRGGVISIGASISGEPNGTTSQTNATLAVGMDRTGSGIPSTAAAWPSGSGYTHYKWRLDGGAWSVEAPINTPISITGLMDGPHHVEVTGKRDSGLYQDDPLFGEEAVITRSRTWTVARLRIISETLAGTDFTLHFVAEAGVTYTVQYRDAFDAAHPWMKFTDVPAQSSTGDHAVTDSMASPASRFYRVVTPQQP